MTDNRPIAIFDSGVGGITVLHEAMKLIPNECYIYYADIAHVPYGTKTRDEVKALLMAACDEISTHDPKGIIIACNTATSVGIDQLRAAYEIPIIGMEPAVRPAVERSTQRIVVLATDLTLQEKKYTDLVQSLGADDQITSIPMPELVEAAEEFNFDSAELRSMLTQKLGSIDWEQHDSLVLGCTHFVYYRPLLRTMIPDHVAIIDGNAGTVRRLKSLIVASTADSADLRCVLSGKDVDAELLEPYLQYLQLVDHTIHLQN